MDNKIQTPLTPVDVQEQSFPTVWRGYEPEAVHRFLRAAADHMEAQEQIIAQHASDLKQCARELDEHRQRERDLRDAMLSAQRAIETIRQQAQREADNVVHEAKLQAERLLQQAHGRMHGMMEELNALKRQRVQMIEELRGVLSTHQKLLDLHETMEAERADITTMNRVSPLSHVPIPAFSMIGVGDLGYTTGSSSSSSSSSVGAQGGNLDGSQSLGNDDDLEIDLSREAMPDLDAELLNELQELKIVASRML